MNLNEPSGLLESDFEKVFVSNSKDINNVFKENYKVFKEVEEKYGINRSIYFCYCYTSPVLPSHTDTLDRLNAIVCFRKCQVKG